MDALSYVFACGHASASVQGVWKLRPFLFIIIKG